MRTVLAVAVAIAASATVASAQGAATYNKSAVKTTTQAGKTASTRKVRKAESQSALKKEAKISEATARATALKEVPNGTIKSSEIERENGKLIYSFDINVPGKTGIEEVNVNANDGSVVNREHESPKAEKKEAAQEAKQKKTAAKK